MLDFVKALSSVNPLAVFVGAFAAFAVGALWYSPALFSKPWMKELGLKTDFMNDPKTKAGLPMLLAGDFAVTLALGLGIAMLLSLTGGEGLTDGLALGAFSGIMFSATTTGINYLFERRSLKLFAINAGYAAVMCAIIGAVVGVWPR